MFIKSICISKSIWYFILKPATGLNENYNGNLNTGVLLPTCAYPNLDCKTTPFEEETFEVLDS